MECEEADVLEMIYNISYFSEETNDKLDEVWFIHVSWDERGGKKDSQVNCLFLIPRSWHVGFNQDRRLALFREMPGETLINDQTSASWLGEGNYANIAAILSSLVYGSTPPGDKCVNYYISSPGPLSAAPPFMVWPLVLSCSSALDSGNLCNQRTVLWKPCWAGRGYQACCVQTSATGELVNSLSFSFCPSPFGSSAAQSQKLSLLL